MDICLHNYSFIDDGYTSEKRRK